MRGFLYLNYLDEIIGAWVETIYYTLNFNQ